MGTMSTAHTASEDGRVHTQSHTPVQADKGAQLRMNPPELWQSSVSTVNAFAIWQFERMKNDEKECTAQGLNTAKVTEQEREDHKNHNIITIVEQFLVTFIRSSWREFAVLA